MSREEQIKQLAQDIFKCGDALNAIDFLFVDNILDTHFARIARKLIDKGYRKEQDTLKEFVEYVKRELDKNIEWRTESAEYADQHDYPIMAVKYYALIDENYNFKQDLDQDLENFIKEREK